MFPQATDFRTESEALFRLLEPLSEDDFGRKTRFKGWAINDVVGHLHLWNWAADLSLRDTDAFVEFISNLKLELQTGTLREFDTKWRGELKGRELLSEWHNFYQEMSDRFAVADPRKRLKWAGPDMSVRSSITARLMETWAHGQEVYDLLGVVRTNADHIKNIVILGINTFGWTYVNRSMDVPADLPGLLLTAPSGDLWEWGDTDGNNLIEGAAQEFCQVVTQVRNIGDTNLQVSGDIATHWMSIAQCFAGQAQDPPEVGVRFTEAV